MEQKTVLLGMSGGVDSSVAAILLMKQGYKVIGAFMRNFSENKNKLTGECNWVEELSDARKIAARLGIPLVVLNFEKEYKKDVIDKMFSSYRAGLTPNPDSLCNSFIKFPLLWREARRLKADFIATGHYVRLRKRNGKLELLRARDEQKDQSYFLYDLKQRDLEHSLFPVGDLSKAQVRELARESGLHNSEKHGSSGICFVGKLDMKKFLQQKIKQKRGKIVFNGQEIGNHMGASYFTIGEKIGNRFATWSKERGKLGKLYVAEKKGNDLIVARRGDKIMLRDEFVITKVNLLVSKLPSNCKVRIRHLGPLLDCKVAKKNGKIVCGLKKGVFGLAEGQSAVLYSRIRVLGGGEIRYN